MRKVVFVTGSRGEYGVLRPVLKAIEKSRDLKLSLIATGMHLLPEFGNTASEIERDGFKIDAKVDMDMSGDTGAAMAKSIGLGVIGIAKALDDIKPDIVLVVGDRVEALAATLAAASMNLPIAHVSGGDVTAGGCIDDSIRHAITKFAHIHFPGTNESAERIIKLGEDPSRVFMVGNPGVAAKYRISSSEKQRVARSYGIDLDKPVLIVIQHPVTAETDEAKGQMTETMEAVVSMKEQTFVFYPNADAGGKAIIDVIKKYERHPFIKIFKNIPRDDFLVLLGIAHVLVGNSSCGIIEAPSFGLPVVNIGTRQEGRERADNVIDVGYDRKEITKAIKKALHDRNFRQRAKRCKNPYADRGADEKIVNVLSRIKITPDLLRKKMTY